MSAKNWREKEIVIILCMYFRDLAFAMCMCCARIVYINKPATVQELKDEIIQHIDAMDHGEHLTDILFHT